jgi:hypothetical protein
MMTEERKLCDVDWVKGADPKIKREVILLAGVDVKISYQSFNNAPERLAIMIAIRKVMSTTFFTLHDDAVG